MILFSAHNLQHLYRFQCTNGGNHENEKKRPAYPGNTDNDYAGVQPAGVFRTRHLYIPHARANAACRISPDRKSSRAGATGAADTDPGKQHGAAQRDTAPKRYTAAFRDPAAQPDTPSQRHTAASQYPTATTHRSSTDASHQPIYGSSLCQLSTNH